jgi:TRAP-type mannitol/chloroaromatic compound transport system permease small subunit
MNNIIARVASFVIYPLIFVVVLEVVFRYILNKPTIYAYDLTWMFYAALVFLGGGYGLQHEVHVRADVFYNKLKARGKAVINMFCYPLLFFTSMAGLLYSTFLLMVKAWQFNETSPYTSWNPPVGPIKTVLFVCILILTLQGIVKFSGHLKDLIKGGGEA